MYEQRVFERHQTNVNVVGGGDNKLHNSNVFKVRSLMFCESLLDEAENIAESHNGLIKIINYVRINSLSFIHQMTQGQVFYTKQ